MSKSFSKFVGETTRDLLDHLDRSHLFPNQGIRYSLDLVDAEAGDSVALFPESDWSSTPDWYIFICEKADSSRSTGMYHLISRLPNSETNNEFVAATHSALLARSPAPEGRAVLVRLLDNGQMTRRDLLRMLSGSSEAQSLRRRVLIIPSPSSWLPEIESVLQDGTVVWVQVTH